VKRDRSIGASALCGAFVGFAAVAFAADGGIETWSEPPNGSSAPTFVAEGVVDAPPARVWALVSNCADYTKNLPNIVASKELSREGDERTLFTAVCEVVYHVPFPFSDLKSMSKATLTADATSGSYSRIWTMIRGDYEVNEGSWWLVPADGGAKTKVTYRIHVRPKLHLPDSLMERSQRTALRQVIQYLRDRTAPQR
jgi:ribosome-associated toxin RatA of RatAB toxin-antitoxin module